MMRTVAQRLLLLASLLLLLATGLLPQSRVPSAQALAQHKNHHTFKLLAVDDDTQLAHATSELLSIGCTQLSTVTWYHDSHHNTALIHSVCACKRAATCIV
jgi:hypothetical protein